MNSLCSKKIIIGVTGGIAAYKIAELIRILTKLNAAVRVVMTDTAKQFIMPLTYQALSGHHVYTDDDYSETHTGMDHIDLARWADLILIAPASANTIAKLANGFADNLLSTVVMASKAPLIIAPAMNQQMWANRATQANIATLQGRAIQIIGPADGAQACGDIGAGRMLEPHDIATLLSDYFSPDSTSLQDKLIVITAGPTQESIDPIRFLSNHSSGKMGFALADAAVQMGAHVTLIAGPTHLPTPNAVHRTYVHSAEEMFLAAQKAVESAHIFISAAAVADYTPITISEKKLKKSDSELTLTLKRTTDILKTISLMKRTQPLFCVGFAAETHAVEGYAMKKLKEKQLDMIIANDVSRSDIGFQSSDNQVTIITPNQPTITLAKAPKSAIAKTIMSEIAAHIVISKAPN